MIPALPTFVPVAFSGIELFLLFLLLLFGVPLILVILFVLMLADRTEDGDGDLQRRVDELEREVESLKHRVDEE